MLLIKSDLQLGKGLEHAGDGRRAALVTMHASHHTPSLDVGAASVVGDACGGLFQ